MTETFKPHQPMYLQLRELIRTKIEEGEYQPYDSIPSENELAAEFNTTRPTVRNAVDALVEEGLLRRVQGKGVYVVDRSQELVESQKVRGFREGISAQNAVPTVKILSKNRRPAGEYYARLFSIQADDMVLVARRLNYVNNVPISIERTVIPLPIFPEIEKIDIALFSLYDAYALFGHPIAQAVERLDMVRLTARDARFLEMKENQPVMVYDCISYDEMGAAMEHSRMLRRGDRASYAVAY